MNIENYSYVWNEKKNDYVLVKTEFGYAIVDKMEKSMLLISDENLEKIVINKMLECGNKIYDNINQAYSDN